MVDRDGQHNEFEMNAWAKVVPRRANARTFGISWSVPTVWSSVRTTITFGGTTAFGGTPEVELADPPPVQLASTPITTVRARKERPM